MLKLTERIAMDRKPFSVRGTPFRQPETFEEMINMLIKRVQYSLKNLLYDKAKIGQYIEDFKEAIEQNPDGVLWCSPSTKIRIRNAQVTIRN